MNQDQNIRLYLDRSTHARKFDEKELIHGYEFQKVKDWIKRDLDEAKKVPEKRGNFDRDRRHDTITILGTRGSGKTSFLLSLLTAIEKEYGSEIEVLEIIDPTLIEEKGHIFLDVLSVIREKVEPIINDVNVGIHNERHKSYQNWRDLMESLAHGLPHVDGIGGNLTDVTWQDPEYIMQRGLRSVRAARDLETNFTEAVKLALEILGKKAFVIAFDDIDIDFKKGWPVLELLRKYFVSKQLITLLSGDMRLFSLAVRKRQWANFGEELIKQEGITEKRLNNLRNLVTETESQYLQKVMKPVRRIHLNTLYDKLRVNPETSITVHVSERLQASINSFYDTILANYGIRNSYQAEIYRSFLLSSPLRLQIRFLEANSVVNNISGSGQYLDPFISDLYELHIDPERITSSPQQLNIAILELLLREKILSESNQLQPTTASPVLNGALTALSLLFSTTSRYDPSLVFDYLVRIGYLRNLLSSIGYLKQTNGEEDLSTVPSIEGLVKHSGLQQNKVIKDNIGMVSAYVMAVRNLNGDQDKSFAGIIPLKSLSALSHLSHVRKSDRIDFIGDRNDPLKKALIYLPLSISQHPTRQGGTVIYSFHVLLAAISELIRKVELGDIFRGIAELSQIRSYPMPDFRQSGGQSTDFDDLPVEEEGELFISERYYQFERALKLWYDTYKLDEIQIPVHLMGKIGTRFFFAADGVHSAQDGKKLGEIMHALTAAFLNAVLIEDAKENMDRPNINLNNTRMSDSVLLNNLRVFGDLEELKFSKWIFSCPLLLAYLDPDSALYHTILNIASGEFLHQAFSFSVYNELLEVSPKYRLAKPRNYDTIIKRVLEIDSSNNLNKNQNNVLKLVREYNNRYPSDNMTAERMTKIIEYVNYKQGE